MRNTFIAIVLLFAPLAMSAQTDSGCKAKPAATHHPVQKPAASSCPQAPVQQQPPAGQPDTNQLLQVLAPMAQMYVTVQSMAADAADNNAKAALANAEAAKLMAGTASKRLTLIEDPVSKAQIDEIEARAQLLRAQAEATERQSKVKEILDKAHSKHEAFDVYFNTPFGHVVVAAGYVWGQKLRRPDVTSIGLTQTGGGASATAAPNTSVSNLALGEGGSTNLAMKNVGNSGGSTAISTGSSASANSNPVQIANPSASSSSSPLQITNANPTANANPVAVASPSQSQTALASQDQGQGQQQSANPSQSQSQVASPSQQQTASPTASGGNQSQSQVTPAPPSD